MILLETSLNKFINALGLAAIAFPIANILLGLVPTLFKRWIIEKKQFSERSNYLKEKLFEDLSMQLFQIFDRGLNTDINLRGVPPESSDLLSPYHKKIQKHNFIVAKLDHCFKVFKILDRLSFWIIFIGVIIILLITIKILVTLLVIVSVGLIFFELALIYIMYRKVEVLEGFEHDYKT